ncbi:nam9 protein [Lentinula raphanica]|nr:nam9 protein [Lentinula raphanica]
MRDVGVYSFARAMPRMSWHPRNLYSLHLRSLPTSKPSLKRPTSFSQSEKTLFQQRWISKALARAYHGDYIPEKIFQRWYVPEGLPNVRPARNVSGTGTGTGDDRGMLEEYAGRKSEEYEEEEIKYSMAPVGSLMFTNVERRMDTVVFRSCFAKSIYEARRLVVHGNVRLNGKRHQNPNTRLKPGDMISVDPRAMRFFKPPRDEYIDNPNAHLTSPPLTELTPFHLPLFSSPHLFIPPYIEPSFPTCSAIYLRHPTARPGYSEIPTPYAADGEVIRFAWEWYARRRPRVRSVMRLGRIEGGDREFEGGGKEKREEREKERREMEVMRRREERRRGGMILTAPASK